MITKEVEAKLLEETRELVKKWEKTGLLDNIATDINPKMSILLENFGSAVVDGVHYQFKSDEEREQFWKEYNERNPRQKTN